MPSVRHRLGGGGGGEATVVLEREAEQSAVVEVFAVIPAVGCGALTKCADADANAGSGELGWRRATTRGTANHKSEAHRLWSKLLIVSAQLQHLWPWNGCSSKFRRQQTRPVWNGARAIASASSLTEINQKHATC